MKPYIAGWFGGFDGIVKSFVGDEEEEEEEETIPEAPQEETVAQVVSQEDTPEESQLVDDTPHEKKAVSPRDDDRPEAQALADPVGPAEDQTVSVARGEETDGVAEKAQQDPSTAVTNVSKSSKKKKKKRNKGQAKAVDTLAQEPAQQAPVPLAQTGVPASDAEGDMTKRVSELERTLKIREEQLERQAEEIAEAKRVSDQLMKKNEELAMAKASVSEKDVADIETCVSTIVVLSFLHRRTIF